MGRGTVDSDDRWSRLAIASKVDNLAGQPHAVDIHLAPGPAAGGSLSQSGLVNSGTVLVNQDVLTCGPLLPVASLHAWREARQQYLRRLYVDDHSTFSFEDHPRDLLTNAETLRSARRITLWIGTGLADQLFFTWVANLLNLLGIDIGTLQVVQFDRHAAGAEVVSAGVLHPVEYSAHSPAAPVHETAAAELSTAWQAVTAPDPTPLLTFINNSDHTLPFLRRALRALLYRYPAAQTGVNAWEDELLSNTLAHGPRVSRIIGYTIAHDLGGDTADWVTEAYLFERIRRLSDPSHPRPVLKLSAGSKNFVRDGELELTESGQDLLSGRGNFIEWNGIDDWIGGVHLDSSHGRLWYRDGLTLVRGPRAADGLARS